MTATTHSGPNPQPVKRRRWIKWVALAVLLVIGLPAGCTYWVFGLLANSEAAKIGVARAEAHPAVQAKLGSPLKSGRFVSGSINVNGPSGSADISVPVTGPKGSGTLYIKATKAAGQWTIESLQLAPDDGSARIPLVGAGIRS